MKPTNLIREKAVTEDRFAMLKRGDPIKSTSALTVYLHPGQLLVSGEPYSVTTILGSCVAVCIHDALLNIGGIAHFILPLRVGNGEFLPRFGNVAIQKLIDGLMNIGSQKRNLQAKLFGGACVVPAFRGRDKYLGTQNFELAREVLKDEGIDIIAEDVGGLRARKLVFNLHDGTAWVKVLNGD